MSPTLRNQGETTMTHDGLSRKCRVFQFWALAWFALGIGMAVSTSISLPLMVMFAIGHFGLYPIVLYYAIKLSNEIWKEEGEEGQQHSMKGVENVHGITSAIEELVQMTCSLCRAKTCNGRGDCSGIDNARKALAELNGDR